MKDLRLVLGLGLVLVVAVTGCSGRTILRVEDHPTQPMTLLETWDERPRGLWTAYTYQFWECKDGGAQLACRKACDGDGQDTVCPGSTVPFPFNLFVFPAPQSTKNLGLGLVAN